MQRTEIEWVINPDGSRGFVSNPIKGQCLHKCPYCYAEGIRKHWKRPAETSYHYEELEAIEQRKKPATIFIGSAYDIFGDWVPDEIVSAIVETAGRCPQHTIIFLTKNAQRMWWECYEKMPANVWFGGTVTHRAQDGSLGCASNGYAAGGSLYAPRNSFISFEPLLEDVTSLTQLKRWTLTHHNTKWAIIGSLNKNGKPVLPEKGGTKKEWVLNLLSALDNQKIPVFVKNEIYQLYPELSQWQWPCLCRELPYLKQGDR